MDKCADAVIGWCIVGVESAESADVVDLYMYCTKPEGECIDSLVNLGSRHSTFKGGGLKWLE